MRLDSNLPMQSASRALVVIDEPNDVVFAEIGAGLNLDEMEWEFAGVLESMRCAERYVSGLIFREQDLLLIARHPRGARDDDPVLCSMMVHLQ